ncbi:cell division protein FtsB [Aliiglaciecola sp. LCG003]|uniref:cell division protein FtsB n=1 Tax=Aliiglaciecola sp. LCG003 TaxID=3053655 RepID=UPI002573CEE8|nr:cell division protein FtsB [Aliiglaciecola sp. LCG003]WJG09039.1 cell division protein FtsB [Aliiglaciecola sp. LCG003]
MKWLTITLLSLLVLLQYRLWFGKNSIPDYVEIKQQVTEQQQHNSNLQQRNSLLIADIRDLKMGVEAMEERARNELGLIKEGETFYRILPSQE